MRNRRRCPRGFTSTRTLVALFITMIILPLAVSVFTYVGKLNFDYSLVNNELALVDLRRILLIAYDMNISDNELDFIYHNDDYSLKLVNEKLLLQPGSQMFLSNIVEASFYTENGCIYVAYTTNEGKEYVSNIGKEKGIYLDDFSFDNDELFERDDGDE